MHAILRRQGVKLDKDAIYGRQLQQAQRIMKTKLKRAAQGWIQDF